MESVELQEIRNLFDNVERQVEPGEKLLRLEDALSASHSFISTDDCNPVEKAIAENLHRAYLRRTLRQLISTRKIARPVIYGYARLLIFGDSTTRSIISNDHGMACLLREFSDRYQGFFGT